MNDAIARSGDILTEPYGNTTSNLLCPSCEGMYLHHQSVTVYDRAEDAPTERMTTVHAKGVEMTNVSSGTGNPSARRDGIVISFTCELCGAEPIELTIAQHKGCTELGWRFGPKADGDDL